MSICYSNKMHLNPKILALGTGALFILYVLIQLFVPSDIGSTQVEVQVPEGSTFKQALNVLYENSLIRDKNLFLLIGKLSGQDRRIRAGYYAFWGHMSPLDVYLRLLSGKIIEYDFTVIEGDSLPEIGKKLAASKIMTAEKFEKLTTDKNFMGSLKIEAPSLEGYLYPQTYKFPKGAQPEAVIKLMVNKLREEFSDDLQKKAKKMGWSENEVLTLASIIEREAVTEGERTLISAVYHNRIKKGMPLQADPTAVYGVKSYRKKITRDDLKKKTRYNTYVIKGLPPGPIASPGIRSIIAALHPADVGYLYFVAQGDGSHYFSKTMAEHVSATRKLRVKQAAARKEEG